MIVVNTDSSMDDGLEPIWRQWKENVSDSESEQPPSGIVLFLVTFLLKFQLVYKISDTAIVLLLRFIKYLIMMIGKSFTIPTLQNSYIPASIQGCHSLVGSSHMPFKEYVVCPTCHLLYDPEVTPLTEGTTSNKRSVRCKYVKFPNHPREISKSPTSQISEAMWLNFNVHRQEKGK